jgi:hypothetical protein
VGDDTVAQLVADDIERVREADELPPVAVAVDHLLAIPERVVQLA